MAIPNVEVQVAMGAGQAWTMLQDVRPDDSLVIVTDMRLPDADGIELIKEVKQHAVLARAPVVAVSGDADPSIARELARLGVDTFDKKPYSPIAVAHHLRTLLDARPEPA